ncbi:MAG: dephospho-CoA kinase [Clostridiales bacterium]|nr:dephospho-CoA kinase [Clostridiales bacterium]
MKIIGLTGKSGSGKSSVCSILSEHGGYIIDSDKIAHKNMRKGSVAYNAIKDAFGDEILFDSGEIDRKKLGKKVFSDPEKLKILNEISLKHILEKISEEIDDISKKTDIYKFIVIDAPLLIETGLNYISDEVWVILADENILLDRIIKRDKIDFEYAKNRLKNQRPQKELTAFADVVIENGDISQSELKKRVLKHLPK